MIIRILVGIGLVVLGAGFIFFAANVIWLGTREFFRLYGPKSDPDDKNNKENNNANNATKKKGNK